jgi:hypothetical protein
MIRDSIIENAEGSHEQKRVSTLLQKVVVSILVSRAGVGLQTWYHPTDVEAHNSTGVRLKNWASGGGELTPGAACQRVRAWPVSPMQGLRLRADQPHVLA